MKLNLRPTSGWAVVLLSVVALSLAGCGRKGGLDSPSASGAPAAYTAPEPEADPANKPYVFNSNPANDAPPTAPKGPKRPFILDPLLGDK